MSSPDLTRREFAALMAGTALAGRVLPPTLGFRVASSTQLLSDIMVPMRDGVRLATDAYLPGGDGPWPVILERTPYGKTIPSRSERTPTNPTPLSRAEVADFFVKRGYVVVYQDCRGRYKSEGEFVKYLGDGNDGYDTCAWMLKQPWCNGKIGTMGLSYAAHTQGALGSAGAPGVAAMFLDSGGFSNTYQGGVRQGGAVELEPATWEFGEFDDYWKQLGIYAAGFHDQFVDAPMVHMSSWYDPYRRTATDNYIALSKEKKSSVRLILGPWTHGDRQLTYAGDVDFGPAATIDGNVASDFLTLRARWFDRWLKGVKNGVDAEPKVRLFVMGGGSGRKNAAGRLEHGGRWRAERDWPIPDTKWTPYYVHRSGALSLERPGEDFTWDEFTFDPKAPVPSIGGTVTSGAPVMVGGAFDQREGPRFLGSREPYRPLSDRSDVLVFQTPPLAEDVEVTGPITANLWISSNCPDTDFTIKLIDVYPANTDYPEGFAMNLTDGILRVRYRDSWEKPALMTPGEVYRVKVEAFPTSNRFVRGHRIRLDISSSNFPHFDVNPNTGESESKATSFRVATNRVYLDRARPSHVVLPIISRRSF